MEIKKQNSTKQEKNHRIELDNHKLLSISGVKNVPTFSDKLILVELDGETLNITGHSLNIKHLDIESGMLVVDGYVSGLKYNTGVNVSLIKKIFK